MPIVEKYVEVTKNLFYHEELGCVNCSELGFKQEGCAEWARFTSEKPNK